MKKASSHQASEGCLVCIQSGACPANSGVSDR